MIGSPSVPLNKAPSNQVRLDDSSIRPKLLILAVNARAIYVRCPFTLNVVRPARQNLRLPVEIMVPAFAPRTSTMYPSRTYAKMYKLSFLQGQYIFMAYYDKLSYDIGENSIN